ncbi:uncharacterized protein LOC114576394 [Exaiptasia diaphana]|uniref:Uncharacterized protein n=1 Tax=Exaiptasia diaphana TaxID=2652724 RepID=A0A913YW81_EXADI|nr:uncharacterized protein LOC114576394 [Exaiptasia diaphana]
MRNHIDGLTTPLTHVEVLWWQKFLELEEHNRSMWLRMSDEDYEAGNFKFCLPWLKQAENDEEEKTPVQESKDVLKSEENLIKMMKKTTEHIPIQEVSPKKKGRRSSGKENANKKKKQKK